MCQAAVLAVSDGRSLAKAATITGKVKSTALCGLVRLKICQDKMSYYRKLFIFLFLKFEKW